MLRPLVARLEQLRVSVSEIDHQDAWQLATIGVAAVAPQAGRLDQIIETVKRVANSDPRLEVVAIEVSHLEEP